MTSVMEKWTDGSNEVCVGMVASPNRKKLKKQTQEIICVRKR